MKAAFITTESNEIPKYIESFTSLGHDAETFMFQHSAHRTGVQEIDAEVEAFIAAVNPKIIVYVGACGACTKPSVPLLVKFNKTVAPTVLICSDAADEESPWWTELREHDREGSFRVIVAIDGNKNWPLADKHITALTPINPKWFGEPKKHADRTTRIGFAGNIGKVYRVRGMEVGRKLVLDEMFKHHDIKLLQRDQTILDTDKANETYRALADFMLDCRMMPNFAETGSFQRLHVKGRVVECGLAGCLLFETRGSPARDWFVPGEDYIEYQGAEELKKLYVRFQDDPVASQALGFSLRWKVLDRHTPAKFWGRILERL